MRKLFLFGFLFLALFSCDKKTTAEIDDEWIQAYLQKTNIKATKHSSGLYYIIEKEGNGIHPTIYDDVEVKYKAYLLDSTVKDPGVNPIISPLTGLYVGWQYGIPLFSIGGKGKLFIPRAMTNKYDVMIFDIELRNILP